MKNLTSKILLILLVISVGFNLYQYYFPTVEKVKGEIVYLPGEKQSTIVYKLPDGSQSATVKVEQQYEKQTASAKELINEVKNIPDLEKEKEITNLMVAKMKLELNLSEKDLAINDKEKEIKKWKDKYNSIEVNNLTNEVKSISEVSPKIATTEKREKFYKPKESYTTITSENPAVKFYGVESYQFKNPKQKDFVELNLKVQGLYLNDMLIPYGGAEVLFNPDGKLKPIVGYGYFYQGNKLYPYWLAGLQFNLLRF